MGENVSDEIDPEIAALLGGSPISEYKSQTKPQAPAPRDTTGADLPDFTTLFGNEADSSGGGTGAQKKGADVDLTRKGFCEVERIEEEKPNDFFSDTEYYKKALGGEGEEAQRLHSVLAKYMQATDPKDKGIFRQQLIPAFWNAAQKMALKAANPQTPLPKLLTLRFGALLPSMIGPQQKELIQKIIYKKTLDEPVYYVDEWLKAVAVGQINASATDEVKVAKGDDRARTNSVLQKAQGKRDSAEGIMKVKSEERRSLEEALRGRVDAIVAHQSLPGFASVQSPYSDAQKKGMSELGEVMRRMIATDKELTAAVNEFQAAAKEYEEARQRMDGMGEAEKKADFQTMAQEFETLRQMNKLCIGRQGNHFPILSKDYLHCGINDVGSRENVVKILAWIESIDKEAFCRMHKTTLNRIVPYVLLLPCYGDNGMCWEPFDRFNRATSRGRIAVPMFPKSLQSAVIGAVGDLRWQVAKEKASYYWMEEGLTGYYYQWFTSKKLKGDVKEYFQADYEIWITKESDGIQRLDKDVRGIFWRYMPFSQPIKEKLKGRSYVYQELYQKDVNKTLSDGY